MAIRDAWRRLTRRSVSSASTASSGAPTEATAATSSTAARGSPFPSPVVKQPGRLVSWLGGSPPPPPQQKKKKKKEEEEGRGKSGRPAPAAGEGPSSPRPPHPSERPLTATNLRHQEMLGGFEFRFGRGAGRRGGSSCGGEGVSPGCSRQPSADAASPGGGGAAAGAAERRVSSLARGSTREE